ncbi:MAG: hypothetical protein R3C40_05275 [Parvularculaceae bacterium]
MAAAVARFVGLSRRDHRTSTNFASTSPAKWALAAPSTSRKTTCKT